MCENANYLGDGGDGGDRYLQIGTGTSVPVTDIDWKPTGKLS